MRTPSPPRWGVARAGCDNTEHNSAAWCLETDLVHGSHSTWTKSEIEWPLARRASARRHMKRLLKQGNTDRGARAELARTSIFCRFGAPNGCNAHQEPDYNSLIGDEM